MSKDKKKYAKPKLKVHGDLKCITKGGGQSFDDGFGESS